MFTTLSQSWLVLRLDVNNVNNNIIKLYNIINIDIIHIILLNIGPIML